MSAPRQKHFGPRILFKSGEDGAYVFAAHFRDPAICQMIAVAAETAPPLSGDTLVITEGFRPERTGKPSLHPKCKAIDIRTGVERAMLGGVLGDTYEMRMNLCFEWAARMRKRHGADFDVVFGDPSHINHIHKEHDPK